MKQITSQIATDYDQSKHLLKLGVSPETADMRYESWNSRTDGLGSWSTPSLCIGFNSESSSFTGTCTNKIDTPAWSLSQLLNMLPKNIPMGGIIGEDEKKTAPSFLELSVIPTMQFQCSYVCHKSRLYYEAVGDTDVQAVCRMVERLIKDGHLKVESNT